MSEVICRNELRREKVRRQEQLSGLDYVEVGKIGQAALDCDNQCFLRVYFLGKAPVELDRSNVRIEGGRRVCGIFVEELGIVRKRAIGLDDYMEIRVNKPGDFSTYTLRVVEKVTKGEKSEWRPHSAFDPQYNRVDFSFKVDCPNELDCRQEQICPPEPLQEPVNNYLAKDYSSFRQLILDRLALTMPDWQERHVPDIGITLVEVLAYVGDHLSYYQDAVATEAYLDTARQRISVRRHARFVNYRMHEGCNARTWITVTTDSDLSLEPKRTFFITGSDQELGTGAKVLTEDELRRIPPALYEVFEPLTEQPIQLYQSHNSIELYTWGDEECCLPRGATGATLFGVLIEEGEEEPDQVPSDGKKGKDGENGKEVPKPGNPGQKPDNDIPKPEIPPPQLYLKPGDILIFEELKGPKTGEEADADPKHRHAVRLTRVEPGLDQLDNTPVVEIGWAEEDALPFPLCISSLGLPSACTMVEKVSVARGNVILVDHGRRQEQELGTVTTKDAVECCKGEGILADQRIIPAPFHPFLDAAPLTFSQSVSSTAPAATCLFQDVRQALPQIWLTGVTEENGPQEQEVTSSVSVQQTAAQDTQQTLSQTMHTGMMEQSGSQEQGDAPAIPAEDSARQAVQQSQDMDRTAVQEISADSPIQSDPPVAQQRQEVAQQAPEEVADDSGNEEHSFAWCSRYDLFASGPNDRHFVTEMDDDGRAHLRFGNDEFGRQPEAGMRFSAEYRIGNGLGGNVGAEAVSRIVLRKEKLSGGILKIRNPLAAQGGTGAEPMEEVKLYAPHTFRRDLQRAIIAEDYAAIVEREFKNKVQRAAARLRWNGSWYQVLVTVDPLGREIAEPALLTAISQRLYPYRRIGHDIVVRSARQVPLEIIMRICVLPDYLRGHVKAALLELFSNRLLLRGGRGFFHPDNLTFGDGIYVSRLVAAAQGVAGVESVEVVALRRKRIFASQQGQGAGLDEAIEKGVLSLDSFEVARLDNDPSFPENGTFELDMRGGR